MPPSSPQLRAGALTLALSVLVASGCAWFNQRVGAGQDPDPNDPVANPAQPQPGGWFGSPTVPTAELWRMPADPQEAEPALRELLERAKAERLTVAIAGGRQGQTSQSFASGGLLIDMRPYRGMALDAKARVLHVRVGARWKEVLPYLHARGFSPAVMQSGSDFTVGASIATNSFGDQPTAPIASSVQAFRIMLADGRIVRCSRTERSELFKLAIGGYGLFGVMLDAELRVVPNVRYRVQRFFVRPENLTDVFEAHSARVGLAFARLSVAPGTFLREGVLTAYSPAAGTASTRPLPDTEPATAVKRRYWRDAIGSTGGKLALWEAEKRADTGFMSDFASRNELLNASADSLMAPESEGACVRQTFLVPRRQLDALVEQVRQSIPGNKVDMLEAGISPVGADTETVLRYADQPMFALTLVFHQARTEVAERDMQSLTGRLIDAALALKGRHMLPYRLHASAAQFLAAYPQAPRFFEAKRRYDPDERFQNQLYVKHGRPPAL